MKMQEPPHDAMEHSVKAVVGQIELGTLLNYYDEAKGIRITHVGVNQVLLFKNELLIGVANYVHQPNLTMAPLPYFDVTVFSTNGDREIFSIVTDSFTNREALFALQRLFVEKAIAYVPPVSVLN